MSYCTFASFNVHICLLSSVLFLYFSFLKELISEEGWNNYDPHRIKFYTDLAKTNEMRDDLTVGEYLNYGDFFYV